LFVLLLMGCGKAKPAASGTKHGDNGEVEPEQLRPAVDAEFQEVFFQAQLEKARDNKQKAYDLFEQALKIEPTNAATHYELGRADMLHFNNPSSALDHAKVCVASDKTNPWYQELLADAYAEMAKYDAAIKAYREAVRLNPNNYELLYELANTQLHAGKIQDAIATYDELERRTGVYEDLSMQKHTLYMQQKDVNRAGLEFERLAKYYPDEPRYWGMAAQFYQQYGMHEKAAAALEQMVKADPDNGQVHFQLSEYYAMQKNDKRSYEELKLAFATNDISIDQKIKILIRYYTLTEAQQSYLPQAYELLVLTEQLQPNEPKAFAMYGDYLFRDGKLREALTKYKQAIALGGSLSTIWTKVLEIEYTLGDFDALYADSKQAISLFPLLPEFYYFQALSHQRRNEHNSAIELLNTGKELVVDDRDLQARFYASLGESYHYTNQHEESDEAFNESLRLDPSSVFTLNNYAYYLSLRKLQLEKAAEMAKRANELAPNVSSFEDTYAYVLFRQAKYAEALVWMDRALAHGEKSAELYEHRGDILFKLGRTEEAFQQWIQAESMPGASAKLKEKIAKKNYID
jgi:tetratricopeptide (TPR) repeat protein